MGRTTTVRRADGRDGSPLVRRARRPARPAPEPDVAAMPVVRPMSRSMSDARSPLERSDPTGEAFRRLAERSREFVYRYRLTEPVGFDYVSPAVVEMTGYSPSDFYADPDLADRMIHPADRELLDRILAGDGPDPVLLRWVRQDGVTVWTEQHNVLVRDDAGRPVALEGSARDVTARERAREAAERSAQQLRTLLERVDMLAGSVDAAGRVTYANPAFLAMTGRSAEEVEGVDWFATFVPPDQCEGLRDAYLADLSAGRLDRDVMTSILTADGSVRQARLHVVGLHDDAGRPVGAAMLGEDLTETEERASLNARLAAAIEQTADSVVITDTDARVIYVNPAFERVSGYQRDEIVGQNPRLLKSGHQGPDFYRRMWRTLMAGTPWSGELVNRAKDGHLYVEVATIAPVRDASGATTAYVGVKRDVTRVRELRELLDSSRIERETVARSLALLEPGPTLEVSAERIVAVLSALPGVAACGVLVFENGHGVRVAASDAAEELGMSAGDLLPDEQGVYLRDRAVHGPWVESMVPEDDGAWHSVRSPGDPASGPSALTAVVLVPIVNEHGPVGLLAVGSRDPHGTEQLAMRIASVIEVAAVARTVLLPHLYERFARDAAVARIRTVIDEQAFRPVFQPIVDLATGRPVGFEALTRFADGVRPDRRFADARAAGIGLDLEAATMARSLAEAVRLPADAWLSLNVSPALVRERRRLTALLAGQTRPLVLEITENEVIDDYAALREAVRRIGSGVRLAVDDAGAGVANFRHLVEIRPDFVKMDRGLVHGIDGDVSRQAFAAGLQHFTGVTGAQVIAEGVETEAELAALVGLGIPLGQGYLLGRPAAIGRWKSGSASVARSA